MTTYDSHPDDGLERRSQANELDRAHSRSGPAGRRCRGDRADRQRDDEVRRQRARSPPSSHASTNGGGCQPPDDIKDAVKAGYYVVQSGDNFTTIADRTCLSEDQLQRLNPNLDPFGLQPQNCVDLVENGCKALAGG